MSDTVTINGKIKLTDKDPTWTCVVKSEFLKKCSDPENYTCFDLNNKFHMYSFLHNPSGPAIVRNIPNKKGYFGVHGDKEYWIDGKCMTKENPELAKRIEHNAYFTDKLEKTLES